MTVIVASTLARVLRPDEGSLDHVVPRSRGGQDAWENLVWSCKEVNARKGNRLPHEAGLKLLTVPRAPKELPVSELIRNSAGLADWSLFVKNNRRDGLAKAVPYFIPAP